MVAGHGLGLRQVAADDPGIALCILADRRNDRPGRARVGQESAGQHQGHAIVGDDARLSIAALAHAEIAAIRHVEQIALVRAQGQQARVDVCGAQQREFRRLVHGVGDAVHVDDRNAQSLDRRGASPLIAIVRFYLCTHKI